MTKSGQLVDAAEMAQFWYNVVEVDGNHTLVQVLPY